MDEDFKNTLEELRNNVADEMYVETVHNESRIEEVKTAFSIFWRIVDCDDIKWRLDEPFVGSADIMISGNEILIKNPTMFCELLKQVDVAEIVPIKDGKVSFNATYYGTSGKAVKD